MNETTNYKLNKPTLDDPADITQLDGNWDFLDTSVYNRQMKTYTDLTKFPTRNGVTLSVGSETIVGICEELPTGSKLRYNVTSSHNTSIYPYQTGAVEFRKSILGAVDITFWSYSTDSTKRGTWEGKVYNSNPNNGGAWNFYGWAKVYDEHNKPTPNAIGALPDAIVPINKGGTGADDWREAQTNLKVTSRIAEYYRADENPDIDTLTDSLMLIPRDYHKNCPISGNFVYIMQVFFEGINATNNRTQIAFPYSSGKETGIGMAVRTYNGGAWSEWQEIYTDHSKPTPAEIGASPSNHTHTPASIGAATSGHGHALTDSVISGKLPIEKGGTNATDVPTARTNLGFSSGTYTSNNNAGLNLTLGASNSNVIVIWKYHEKDTTMGGNQHYKTILTPMGGFCFGNDSAIDAVYTPDKAKYQNGVLWAKSGLGDGTIQESHRRAINGSGTYNYQIL